MPKMASYVVDRLTRIADDRLKTSANIYKQGLQQPGSVDVNEEGFNVRLVGEVPEALENGYDAFDIKVKMMQSPSRRQGLSGPYVDVPFRHGASEKSTRLQGMPADIKQRMQNAVRREQRAAKREGRSPGTVRLKGRSPGSERVQKLRFGAMTQEVVTRTKQGIYDDMFRTQRKVGKRTQTQYKTIRRISARSAPTSWWHPGYEGVQGMREVGKELESVAERIFKDELRKEGLDVK